VNDKDRFDKFTERARKVLSLAQEEAQRFQHNYIGTEHLLLGLVREGEGVAAKVLSNLGVELNKVRSAVEFIIGRGDRIVLGEIGLTPRAKKVIELAVDEARRLNHHYIGTEHLLLVSTWKRCAHRRFKCSASRARPTNVTPNTPKPRRLTRWAST
jgi:ATP-dependent Clp protease ATP-binding subunit ClpC